MNIESNISVFHSYLNPVPGGEISIYGFCFSIKNGEFEIETAKIRSESDKSERNQLKKLLPAATISGLFTRRANDCLIKHSGFICADFDEKGNPDVNDWALQRNIIGVYPEVYFCSLSVSGRGCFAIIPIRYPEFHRAQFEALKRDFASEGLIIDNCPDVSRLRGVSYDPDAIWKDKAIPYRRVYKTTQPKQYSHSTNSPKIEKLIQWTERKVSFAKGNRHEFIKLLAGACHRFGISESEAKSELLRYQEQDFTANEIEKIIKYMYANPHFSGVAVRR